VVSGEREKVKSYSRLEGRQDELLEEPTVSTGVVPPVPNPVESYIVAMNSSPAGWFRSNVKEYGGVREVGMEMFWI